jgi:hypothetical protein
MARIGVWMAGATPLNCILPLILMGVELQEGTTIDMGTGDRCPYRMHYYTLWCQEFDHIEDMSYRLYDLMGWPYDSPIDDTARDIARQSSLLLRQQYLRVWDKYFPSLGLRRKGPKWTTRMRARVFELPVRPPFVCRSWRGSVQLPWGIEPTPED